MCYEKYLDYILQESVPALSVWLLHTHTHTHAPLQCFPLFHLFPPFIAPTLHLHYLFIARMASPHIKHTQHTSSPSVCAAARVSGTGSSWDPANEREGVSWHCAPESNFLSIFLLLCCCLSNCLNIMMALPKGSHCYCNRSGDVVRRGGKSLFSLENA